MKLIIGLCLAWLSITQASADLGVSYLAQAKFTQSQCTTALKAFDGVSNPALAFLWSTFGNNNTCASRFLSLKANEPHTLLIYATNETCRRAPRYCAAGELMQHKRFWQVNSDIERSTPDGRRYLRALKQRLLQIRDYLKINAIDNLNTNAIVSTGLEDNYTTKVYRKIIKVFKNVFANTPFRIARNPVGNRASGFDFSGADFVELHGQETNYNGIAGRQCIYSNDGADIDFGTGRRTLGNSISVSTMLTEIKRHRNCIGFVWWNTQGIERQFVEPRRRHIRVFVKDVDVAREKILKGNNL